MLLLLLLVLEELIRGGRWLLLRVLQLLRTDAAIKTPLVLVYCSRKEWQFLLLLLLQQLQFGLDVFPMNLLHLLHLHISHLLQSFLFLAPGPRLLMGPQIVAVNDNRLRAIR